MFVGYINTDGLSQQVPVFCIWYWIQPFSLVHPHNPVVFITIAIQCIYTAITRHSPDNQLVVWTIPTHYIPNYHLSVLVIPNLCEYNLRVINQQRFPKKTMSPSWPSYCITPQPGCTKQLFFSAVKGPLRSCNIFILEFPKRYQKHSKAPNRLRKCKCFGGIPTPLKNMTSLVGMMKFPIFSESHSKFHGSSHHQPVIINH